MDRTGNNIIFTAAEQLDYDLPELLPVDEALDTAVIFLRIAKKVGELNSMPSENMDHVGEEGRLYRLQQAHILHRFYLQVENLCPDEALQKMLDTGS